MDRRKEIPKDYDGIIKSYGPGTDLHDLIAKAISKGVKPRYKPEYRFEEEKNLNLHLYEKQLIENEHRDQHRIFEGD
jgi:hypothetical protein